MKRILSVLILLGFLFWGAAGVDSASLWTKYVATDKSYSFHYPSGWKVSTDDSTVGVENSRTDEQIMMVMIPFDKHKSPKDMANGFLVLLKSSNPNVSASNWQSQPESADSQVTFNLSDKSNGKVYSGLAIVNKADQQATWFSYLAPASGYSKARGSNILQGFIGSIATGTASKAPTIDYNVMSAEKIDRNAKSFLFVLEFALGSPFTKSQEVLILNELKKGWQSKTEAELKKYDQYPPMVQTILKMNQKDLEKLRADLEKSVKEWLNGTDKSDPAVKIILSQLKNRGKIIIAGDPPLTDMSLTAYSEIIAYSRLLQKNSKATPDQITQKSLDEIKQQVKKAWKSFSKDDRNDIATAPGLWICQRVLLENGTKAEQDKIRASLKKFGTVTRSTAANNNSSPSTSTGSGDKKPMDSMIHWNMMQMQQQTLIKDIGGLGFFPPTTGAIW